MTLNRIKLLAIIAFAAPLVAVALFHTRPVTAVTQAIDDPAAVYKTKCAMCHTPKAEKFYDPTQPVEEQVTAVLKGKKAEKPPNMPAFEPKGMTPEEAKALVEYMQGLRKPAQ